MVSVDAILLSIALIIFVMRQVSMTDLRRKLIVCERAGQDASADISGWCVLLLFHINIIKPDSQEITCLSIFSLYL